MWCWDMAHPKPLPVNYWSNLLTLINTMATGILTGYHQESQTRRIRMLKLAICDDEEVSREKLSALVQDYARERNTPVSVSSFAAASPVLDSSERFDIYLLDILMIPRIQ